MISKLKSLFTPKLTGKYEWIIKYKYSDQHPQYDSGPLRLQYKFLGITFYGKRLININDRKVVPHWIDRRDLKDVIEYYTNKKIKNKVNIYAVGQFRTIIKIEVQILS